MRHRFAHWLPAEHLDSHIAGLILLAAAPCTAMVFVWSRLTQGDPLFTPSQVALNDAIMVFAVAPIVALLPGLLSITVPWGSLLTPVVLCIAIPLVLAQAWRRGLLRRGLLRRGPAAVDAVRARTGPWSLAALRATVVGVLTEVPVMLRVRHAVRRSQGWCERGLPALAAATALHAFVAQSAHHAPTHSRPLR